MKKCIALVVVFMMLVVSTACGTNLAKYAGVYRGQSMTASETDEVLAGVEGSFLGDLANLFIDEIVHSMTIELREDGTGSINLGDMHGDFEWTVKGKEILLSGKNAPNGTVTVEGNTLTLIADYDGETATFVFVKETEDSNETVAVTSTPTETPAPTNTPAPDLTVSKEYFEAIFATMVDNLSDNERVELLEIQLVEKSVVVNLVGDFDLDADDALEHLCVSFAQVINNTAMQVNTNIIQAEEDDPGNLFNYYSMEMAISNSREKKTYYLEAGSGKFLVMSTEIVKATPTPQPQLECEITDGRVDVFSNSIGTIYAHIVFKVTNVGTENIYFPTLGCDLEDENGHLVATTDSIHVYPKVLAPGETTYVSEFEQLDEKVDNLQFKLRGNYYSATVDFIRYDCSDVTIKDANYGGVKIMGRIENNTKQDEEGIIHVAINLFDKDGKFLHQVSTIISEDLPAGAKFGFECTSWLDPIDLTADQVASYEIYAFPSQWQW